MPAYEIPDFVKGHKTRWGRPTHLMAERVTVVPRDEIDSFLGARTVTERVEHLRWLRDRGLLITEPRRLTQRVRAGTGHERAHVFRCGIEDVPRIRSRPGVMVWG